MQLKAGQRFRLENDNDFIFINSGRVEVYAVTVDSSHFRQLCLFELAAGAAVFPALDSDSLIETEIFVLEDCELEFLGFYDKPVEILIPLMQLWFFELAKVSWLNSLADGGDEILIHWRNGLLFADCETLENLFTQFLDNEKTFSRLTNTHLQTADTVFTERMKTRMQDSQLLIDNSINRLIGESEHGATAVDAVNEAVFIVQTVAKALSLPVDNITIAPEFSARLDQVGLIRRLVQKANIHIRFVTLEEGWYTRDSGVIIGWKGEKLAAFIPETSSSYKMVTSSGAELLTEKSENVQQRGFLCYGGLPNKKLNIGDIVKFIGQHIFRADINTILGASLIAGLVAQMTPIITETIFTDIIPILDRQGLVTVTQVSLVVACTTAIVTAVRSVAMIRLITHIDTSLESAILGRLFKLPAQFFRSYTSGEISARLMGIMEVKSVLGGSFIPTVFDLVFSFWSILLMGYYSLKYTVLAVFLWLIYIVIMGFLYSRIVDYERNLIQSKNKISGLVQQIFTGLAKFRLAGAESAAFNLWSSLFSAAWSWNLKLRWQSNYSTIITSVQPLIITLILYDVISSDMVTAATQGLDPSESVMNSAKFMAFYTAFTGFNTSINSLVPVVAGLFKLRPAIENLMPVLETVPEAEDDKPDAGLLTGAIKVEHLSFSYKSDSPLVINDLSLSIAAGENVAIVGKSGCGKSTFIRLLLGFEQPKSGAIYYDNNDMSEVNLASIRSQMGVVLQNGQLMSGDILTNIIGTSALSIDDAWSAAAAAGIADDIKKMPMGMQTVISEGSSNISGGQRQRILIARALASKPSILVFDEATSALDNRTQAIVTESLNKLKTTRIVIAHRLSTIRECDRIIVFDKGKIAESGTFEDLVAQNGIFAELARRQTA